MRWAVWLGMLGSLAACGKSHPGVCSPEERCGDGIDNDCDDKIDEGCDCAPGDIQACGVGVCAGEQMCEAGSWSECFGGTPSDEICDGKDNDCDGTVDEGSNACGGVCDLPDAPGAPCDGPGDTDQCKEAAWECQGLNALSCPDMTSSTVEICGDHLDNNCDGRTDEYCAAGHLLWEDHSGPTMPGQFAMANDVAIASDGSVYVVGTHQADVTFGGTASVVADGYSDGFILKYSSTGHLLWHQAIAGPGEASVNAIALDSNGTLVVAGTFGNGNAQFSPTVTRSPAGGNDGFVARYATTDGAFVDVATFASNEDDLITSVAISPDRHIAITGQFAGGTLQLGNNVSVPATNFYTFFVAELDSSLTTQWARRIEYTAPGSGELGGKSVAFDAANNLYLGGYAGCYNSCVTPMLAVNRGEPDELLIPATTHDRYGGFLVRYDPTGAVGWAIAPAQVSGVTIAGNALYATGMFYWTAKFAVGLPNETMISASGSSTSDVWVGRFDLDSTFHWAHSFGATTTCSTLFGSTDDEGRGMTTSPAGNPVLTGVHQSSVVMASDLTLSGQGQGNAFWASFTAAGELDWAHNGQIGEDPCTGNGAGSRIAVAPNGDVAVVGHFSSHMIMPDAVIGGMNDFYVTVFAGQ